MNDFDEPKPKASKKKLGFAASLGAIIAMLVDSALLNVPIGTVIGNWIAGLF